MFKRTVIFTMACCISAPLFMSCGDESGDAPLTPCAEGCPSGQHCDEAANACVPDASQEKDCTEECTAGTHCDKTKGECVADTPAEKDCAEECATGTHCDKTTGECVADTPAEKDCAEECTTGTHCDKTTGECVADTAEIECTEECTTGTHCDKTKGECVADTTDIECTEECTTGTHCDKTKGECVADTTEIECTEECNEGTHCDKTKGECLVDVECTEECGENQECNLSTGQCVDIKEAAVIECTETCSAHQHCDTSVGQCVADDKDCTTEGELSCSGSLLLKCSADGYFEMDSDCSDSDTACFVNEDGVTGCHESACNPGDTKCDGTKILKCDAYHKFVDDSDCVDNSEKPVCEDSTGAASCVEKCESGTSLCEDNQVMVCSDQSGKYEISGDCPKAEGVCKIDKENKASCVRFECTDGDMRCSGEVLEKCNAGFYELASDCSAIGYICSEQGGASCMDVECLGNESKCINDKWLFKCNNGTYDKTDCFEAFSANGNNGKCVTNLESNLSSCKEIKSFEDGYDEDADKDKDTIMDDIESCTNDQDQDGKVDCEDRDSDGDGIPDKLEADNEGGDVEPGDADSDGTPNYLDLDSDGNGIPDSVECCGKDAKCLAAKDSEGLFTYCIDTDGDTIPDFLDYDNDGDGFDDVKEIMGMVINPPAPEAGTFSGYGCKNGNARGSATNPVDCDGDTIPDYMDFDSDNDGLCDDFEGTLRINVIGSDNKKHGSYARYNADTDGDGLNDALEAYGATTIPASVTKNARGCYTFSSSQDADKDGFVNQLEVDSDGDGLADKFETMCCSFNAANLTAAEKTECSKRKNWCTNPYNADSDGDGVDDLIEYGAETDPNNPNDNPQSKGNFVFKVPYKGETTPKKESLSFETSVQKVDIYFAVDTSGSMSGELKTLKNKLPSMLETMRCKDLGKACEENSECSSLNGGNSICSEGKRCIVNPKTGSDGKGCYVDMWTGFGVWGDINSFKNKASLSEDTSKTTTALDYAYNHQNADGTSENLIQVPACVADGTDYCTNTSTIGCYTGPGRVGCVGYRTDAIKILVQAGDEANYQSSTAAKVYSYDKSATYAQPLKNKKIRYIGLWGSTDTRDKGMKQMACDAGSCVSGSCTTQASCQNITATERDQLFMYGQIQDATIESATLELVRKLTGSMQLNITSSVEDIDTTNAKNLVKQLVVNTAGGGVVQNKTCAKISNTIVQGTYQGINGLNPGTVVCYDVIPVESQSIFPATDVPQVVKARVKVMGDGSVLNSGIAYFLIPPKIEDNSGEIGNN